MTPESWKEIKRIFHEVVDLPPTEQRIFLTAVCDDDEMRREVEKMLAADSATALEQSPISFLTNSESVNFKDKQIGRYRILREVGHGGMGTVFEAIRDDGEYEQKVAVKIIKSGLNTQTIIRRFRHERQILASLQHPNIARLLDGGMSEEGVPFYVMEFIEGEPIDEYCRAQELNVTQRLALFRQVCAAVSYAHHRLIVHRDLKPSNILVTESGEVKLLDFGIAKVISEGDNSAHNTATQLGLMTPNYASPEQFRGETVTTATDVYSLGIVLHELLTGALPYDLTGLRLDQMLKLVCETEPSRPSRAIADCGLQNAELKPDAPQTDRANSAKPERKKNPQSAIRNPQFLKGDLDNIILKALKKEPERRYDSVEQFSADIQRYLEGLPISARPDTFAYRASKFVQRNRVAVVAASLIFLALIVGILATAYQARVAQRERSRAEQRFDEVRKLANNVVFKYHDAIANLPGATATREMLVKDATEYLDNLAKDAGEDSALQRELASAYLKLGDVQGQSYAANLGDTAGATQSYRKAVALLENCRLRNPEEEQMKAALVGAYSSLASLMLRSGESSGAPEVLQKALALKEELLGSDPDNREYLLLAARLQLRVGDATADIREKLPHYLKALQTAEGFVGANAEPTSDEGLLLMAINQRIGTNHVWLGDKAVKEGDRNGSQKAYSEALPYQESALRITESQLNRDPSNTRYRRNYATASSNLAEALAKNGRHAETLAMMERSLKVFKKIAQEDTNNLEAKADLATVYLEHARIWGVFAEDNLAAENLLKAEALSQEIIRRDSNNVEELSRAGSICKMLAKHYTRKGDFAKARQFEQKTVEAGKLWDKLMKDRQANAARQN